MERAGHRASSSRDAIIGSLIEGDVVRAAPVLFQPIASDDVASAVIDAALAKPENARIEVAGPEVFRFDELVRKVHAVRGVKREVVVDPDARYFGAKLGERSLIAEPSARLGGGRFEDWLRASAAK